jgi:hypothetical protein
MNNNKNNEHRTTNKTEKNNTDIHKATQDVLNKITKLK